MTEEQAVYDAVPDAVPVEDVILTLAGQVDDLRRRIDKLQDANLAPVLESSALLVELWRIADALETLAAAWVDHDD